MSTTASILVIDDEEIMREILEALLTREGYGVRLASSAEEGLEAARSLPFDAAIVDLMLPGMDGIAALEELKKINEELPVLMITAFASVETAITAMKRGAFDYITKPFKNDEVLIVVATRSSGTGWCARTGCSGARCRSSTRSSPTSSGATSACARCST
jgi:DNA-binding NtrC family response regulator